MADEKQQEEATDNFEVVTDEAVGQVEEPESEPQGNEPGEDGDQESEGEDSAKAQQDDETDNDGEQDQANDKDDKADNADDAGAKDDKPKPKRQRFQKRIDRLTREKAEAERRAEEAERRLRDSQQGKGDKKPKGKQSGPSGEEPEPSDFDSYGDYLDALSEWKANDNDDADDKAGDDSDKGKDDKDDKGKDDKPDPEFEEALAEVTESFADVKSRYKDFDEVIGQQDLSITADMVKAMAEADEPGEVAYYLGKNKQEATRIAGLSSIAQAREIGKLEAVIARGNKQPSKKATGAPDPIDPVSGGGSSTTKDVKDMSFDEYDHYMSQQEKKRGGGFW